MIFEKNITHIVSENLGLYQEIDHGFFTKKISFNNNSKNNIDKYEALKILGSYEENHHYALNQIHSNKVIIVDNKNCNSIKQDADALVTNVRGVSLSIITADCAPVLFYDHEANVIAAAHAGWRGAFSGIIEETISKMEDLNAKRSNVIVAIGPTISQKNYEVGPEFYEKFIDNDQSNMQFFIKSQKIGHFYFDLPGFICKKLIELEIVKISNLNSCTYENYHNFHSYRRSTHEKVKNDGRNISIIGLKI